MAIRPPDPTDEDIERNWRENWYTLVCNEMGQIDPESIKNNLYDFTVLMENTSAVFDDLTWGRISKPNTLASEVIGVVHEIEEQERRRDGEELLRLLRREAGNLEDALKLVQEHFGID